MPAVLENQKVYANRQQPYYQLHYKHDGSELTVASEPLDSDNAWKAMKHGGILIARRRKQAVKIENHLL